MRLFLLNSNWKPQAISTVQ